MHDRVQRTHSLSSHINRPLHPNSALYRVPLAQHPSQSSLIPTNSLPPNTHHLRLAQQMAPDSTGVDPSSVDFRTFYPYVPNEVKHRKRTTHTQQVVLERVFRTNTKPNAALRKELACQLGMLARGVQVWFQNRRAKEKKKVETSTARRDASTPKLDTPNSPVEDADTEQESPQSSVEIELMPSTPLESSPGVIPDAHQLEHLDGSSQECSPLTNAPPVYGSDSNPSWPSSPHSAPDDTNYLSQSDPNDTFDAQMLNLRRGSLPVNMYAQSSQNSSHGPPTIDDFDPLTRRRSIDVSLSRLASHPYARLAMEKNGIYGPRLPSYMQGRQNSLSFNHQLGRLPSQARPSMRHRASLPREPTDLRRLSSLDVGGLRYPNVGSSVSPSPSPISPSLPDHHSYAISSRSTRVPPAGPLPDSNFSFGAPDLSPSMLARESENGSPDPTPELVGYSFPRRTEDPDEDEANSMPSCYASSRFGSIASLGSESSTTSAFFSDVGSSATYDSRRGSCASGQFLDLAGLDMTCPPAHGVVGESQAGGHNHGSFTSQENLGVSAPIENNLHGRDGNDGTHSYPSPSSTVSPGGSPHVQDVGPPPFSISSSSELAFALQSNNEQIPDNTKSMHLQYPDVSESPVAEPDLSSSTQQQSLPCFYDMPNVYRSAGNSPGSSLSLGMEFARHYDGEMISATGHYDPYISPPEGHYAPDGSYVGGDGHDGVDLHHQMQYNHCSSDMFSYPLTTSTSSIESGLHGVDSYVNYS